MWGDFGVAESVQSGVLLPRGLFELLGDPPASSPACPKCARPRDVSPKPGAGGERRVPRTLRDRGRGGR